jgi:hypothetical protein
MARIRFGRQDLVVGGNMEQASLTTRTFDSTGLNTFKIIAQWENVTTPTGTLSLESSNDGITFTEITSSSQSITDSDGNFHIWDFPYNPFVLIRAKYVRSTGSGDINIFAQFGG